MASISTHIKNFYNQQVTKQDKLLALLIATIIAIGGVFLTINGLWSHYSGLSFLPWTWVAASPFILGLMVLARLVKTSSPRVSLYTNTYGTYYFISIALGVMCNGIQYTAFPLFDHVLLHFDQWLGFQQVPLIDWTSAHHHVYLTAAFCYDALVFELLLLPPLFALSKNSRAIHQFFLAALITYIVGMLIYYFLPTIGPVDVLSSPNFTRGENQIYLRFFALHHFLAVHKSVGLIAFPSFHVIWAILLTYMVREKKWLFYPVLLLNTGAVLATMMLGWHFLADVLASFVIASAAIVIAKKLDKHMNIAAQPISNVVSLQHYRHNSATKVQNS